MRCEEIMKKKVEYVRPSDTVQTAAQKMRDCGVGFLPVCDESQHVLGVVTDRDITIRAVADNHQASSTNVEAIMSKELVSCKKDDDISKAQELMAQHQKSRICCVDDDGKLIGVISLSDIAQYETAEKASETLKQVASRESAPQAFA